MKISNTLRTTLSLMILAFFIAAMSLTASAQSQNGAISGTVKDTAGAAVSGAEVSLVVAQAVLRTTSTGADGKFELGDLAPGSYAVVVKQIGFGQFSTAVRVNPGEKQEVAAVLEVNPLTEQVTITAEAGGAYDANKLAQAVNVIPEEEIL